MKELFRRYFFQPQEKAANMLLKENKQLRRKWKKTKGNSL